jgi:starvation-inducible DNA-binding protein
MDLMTSRRELDERRETPLRTPSDISPESVREISGALNALSADIFTLYLKTKNFHWHMSGPRFRDYHLLLDDQGQHIFNMTDDIAERVRKIGGNTIHSIGQIARLKRVADNDSEYVTAPDMLGELLEDNEALVRSMKAAHDPCDDAATTSLLENWIDETQRRSWFPFEAAGTK